MENLFERAFFTAHSRRPSREPVHVSSAFLAKKSPDRNPPSGTPYDLTKVPATIAATLDILPRVTGYAQPDDGLDE